MSERWTQLEDCELREMYRQPLRRYIARVVALRIGRSAQAVSERARRLGLSRRCPRWTLEEKRLALRLRQVPGRTEAATRTMRSRLRLALRQNAPEW